MFVFGHAGDGNVHVNVVGASDSARGDIERAILSAVVERSGSISAEHGIGTMKKHYLHLSRSAGDISAMRCLKAAFDPEHILNPNVLLPD